MAKNKWDFFFLYIFRREKGVETKGKKWLEWVESMAKYGTVQVTYRFNQEIWIAWIHLEDLNLPQKSRRIIYKTLTK